MGLTVNVSFDSAVTAKVYLATNSSTAVQFYQDSPTVDGVGGPIFDKTKSAIIFNTYDTDTNDGKIKTSFEALGSGNDNGLKCDANAEMEFYVYVENYSETEIIFCNADVTFTEANGSEPFTVISNPMSITGTAVGEDNPSKSLLTFRIKADDIETIISANTIQIEIDLGAPSSLELAELSWTTINLVSEAGVASQVFNVGDEKTVLINAVPYTFVILGFDHDDKSDDSGKAGITFGMKNLLATTYNMNSTKTNSGGWENCLMRTRMATFFTQLPSDLQSAIKTVNKLATAGSTSTSIITSPDKLFLFSEREIDGTTGAGYVGEGTQYTYWVGKGAADRIKRLSNGSGSIINWWLRSPYMSNNYYFRLFNNSGDVQYNDAIYAVGVCFGFCV
ncbi:MAG: DUF6273 domain-containing protein [Clostridia bacterium]|nr:DUF6273 domain-containing protein [Clostridia bacterium]